MTYWHFLNCSALTFGPAYVIYKSSKLSEYSAYGICLYGGLAYIVTQLLKLIIAATFLPGSDSTSFDLIHEILKSLLGIVDVLGVSYVINAVQGSFETKLLGIALGWGASEGLLTRIAGLWMGARGLEFEWRYSLDALDANLDLLLSFAFVTAVWLYRKKININWSPETKSIAQQYQKTALIALVAFTVLPSVLSFLQLEKNVDTWQLLVIKFAVSAVLYFLISKTSKLWEKNVVQ